MTVKRVNAFWQTIRKFLLDMLPVVFGVLLALMINNLNDAIKEKKTIRELKTHVYSEISENILICESFIEEQEKRNEFFKIYQDSLPYYEQLSYAFSDLPFKGFMVLSINHAARDAAQFSGVLNKLKFNELQLLAGIYQRQQFLLNFQDQVNSFVYNSDTYNPELLKSTFSHFKQLTEDFMGFTKSLVLNYQYFLDSSEWETKNSRSKLPI
jgi:hypothetical protein